MEKRHKTYIKLNLMSAVFIVASFISVTLAWFAYSGLVDVQTEVDVKAWYIELEKDGETVSNNIVISLDDIYPGMTPVSETVNIKNKGDSDATVKYSIVSARILDNANDNYIVNEINTSPYVEDILSHSYPFGINISLSKGYALAKTGESTFQVSVSWPLDSGNDEIDSLWGTNAYTFAQAEAAKKLADPNYQELPSIEIVISVTAEQYIEENTASDIRYNLGDTILYDVVNNAICTEINSTCLETKVIDYNNKLGDTTVTLLPNPNTNYVSSNIENYGNSISTLTTGWVVSNRPLIADDIYKIASLDILNSYIAIPNISDSIMGDSKYENRTTLQLNRIKTSLGYSKFTKEEYPYFTSTNCYWTNTIYNDTKYYAINSLDANNMKLYGEEKTTLCNVVPVLLVNKSNL